MLKKINLKNKTALVTGAGKGLGKACAIALAEAGAKVIILMAIAANLISRWIKKYKWIAWVGLIAILFVAVELIYSDIKTLIL